jgi:hypothetical protein
VVVLASGITSLFLVVDGGLVTMPSTDTDTDGNPSGVHFAELPPARKDGILRYAAVEGESSISVTTADFLRILSGDAGRDASRRLARRLTDVVRACPYDAVFFETMGVDAVSMISCPFEFVLIDAPSLASFAERAPDPGAFREHLQWCGSRSCCTFDSLGGDARLVAPNHDPPGEDPASFSHFAAYVRGADDDRVAELWEMVATEFLSRVAKKGKRDKTWLSTSGLGVAWLHVRIDDTPKYYQYREFARGA